MIYEESHPPTRYQLSFQLHFNPPSPVLGRRVRRFCKRWRRRRRATSSAAWRRSCEADGKGGAETMGWETMWKTMGKTQGKTHGKNHENHGKNHGKNHEHHGIEVRFHERWNRWDDSNGVLFKWDPFRNFPRSNRDPFRFRRARPGPNNEVDRNGWVRSKPTHRTFCWCFASFIW